MKKIIIYSMLIILFLSLVSALDSLNISKVPIKEIPITKFIGDISYINHTKADISQEPYTLTSKDIARVNFKKYYVDDSFDICFDFPVNNEKIIVESIERNSLLGIFDENLKELERENKRICAKTFSNTGDIDIDYKLRYNGIGTIKYNVSILPSKYNKDYDLARAENDLVVLDPYIIGDLKEKSYLYFPFDGDITATSTTIFTEVQENATSTGNDGTWTNLANAYDNDWTTYAENFGAVDKYIYFNYSKPQDSFQAKWKIKYEYFVEINETLDIPNNCWNYNENDLELRVMYDEAATHKIIWSCNSGSWTTIRAKGGTRVFEEEIIWTVANSTPSAINASYHIFGSQGYDFKLMGSSADVFGTDNGVDTNVVYTGQGAVFDETTFIDIPSTTYDLKVGSSFVFWSKFANTPSSPQAVLGGDGNTYKWIRFHHGGTVVFETDTDGDWCGGSYSLDNNWHHYAFIVNNYKCTIYEDNINITTTDTVTDNVTFDVIGSSDSAFYFNGTMRSVFIYDRPITAREVKQLYNNGTYVNNSINETDSAIEFFNSSIQDGIRLPSATTYDLKGGATFSFWGKAGTAPQSYILGFSTTDNTRTLNLDVTNDRLIIETNVGSDFCAGPIVDDKEWHHYVLRVLNYECAIYEDGTAVTMTDSVVTGNVTFNMVGRAQMDSTSSPWGYDGGVDELMLFDYALSLNEIQTLSGGYENAINITVRDEATNEIIPSISLTYYNDDVIRTVTTSTGSLFITGLAPGAYFWTISSDNYTSRKYNFVVQTNQSIIQQENAYLTKETNTVIFTYKNKITGRLLEDVNITISSFVGDELVVLENTQTDISGRVEFSFTEGSRYIFDSVKNGYINKSFELNPIIFTSYTIEMDPTTTIEDSIQGLGISTIYVPHRFSYNDTRTLNYTISSPGGTLINYSLNITYNGVSSVYNGTTATGETLNHTYNLSNISAEYFIVSYDYYSVETGYKSFSYPYRVLIINNSANNTLENMRANAYGIGLFERVLIVVVSSIVTAGIVSFAAGPVAGGAAGLLLMGAFVYLKLISIWLIIIPLIVGFILIVKGSG